MRFIVTSALALSLAASAALANSITNPVANPPEPDIFARRTYEIGRMSKPIVVDGIVDENEWSGAKPIEVRWETFPANNQPAKIKTLAYLGYDEHNLYVGFRAYDPTPSQIRAHLTDRDTAYQDDFIGVVLDTFNDERRGFEFFANPLGVQMDLQMNDVGGGEDDSWDAIWTSAGKIHEDRYDVEMAIPFGALRFRPSDGPQTWGIDVVRVQPRSQRTLIGLHARNKNRACYVCQFSKLTGFTGITPGRNIEISPTVTSGRTDTSAELGSSVESGKFDTEPGVTARWGVTPNLTLNAAVNPDFSQIEADSAQLDINTTFALFYNEKRPFFLEGADFFQTPLNAVYTRTVASPDWGAKLTGKQDKSAGGLFVSRDSTTNLLLPGASGSSFATVDQENLSAVGRYRYDIGKSSTLGMLVTNRSGNDYANRVAGVDGYFRVTPRDTIQTQFLGSQTNYPDEIVDEYGESSDTLNGHAAFFNYRHNTRNWYWRAGYQDIGRDFRADTGFMPRVDYRMAIGALEHTVWADQKKDGKKRWYTRYFIGGDVDRTEQQNGQLLEQEVESWFGIFGPRQSFIHIDIGTRERYYDGVMFDEQFYNFFTEAQVTRRVHAALDVNGGDQIDFANTQLGRRLRIAPRIRYRVSRHLNLQASHTKETLDVDGGQLFDANLSEIRAVYQFNLRMFVRALVQYTDIRRNLALYKVPEDYDARSRHLFPQLLFSYKLNPQTVLFVGYASNREGDDRVDLTESDRTLFVKIGYAWSL